MRAGQGQPENIFGLTRHKLDAADREAAAVLVEGRGVLFAPRDDDVPQGVVALSTPEQLEDG